MSSKNLVTLESSGDVSVLRIDSPPVNAISQQLISELISALDNFERDSKAIGLAIVCSGRTFVAGADITLFERDDFSAAPFNRFLARLEGQPRPVVAGMHGTALGGGFELALACHARVAVKGTKVGLPEVKLGLLPGSLGTQRLPRLVGIDLALDLILSGRMLESDAAIKAGIIDRIASDPLQGAVELVQELASQKRAPRRLSEITIKSRSADQLVLEKATTEAARISRSNPAAEAIVTAVKASLRPFTEGEAVEAKLFENLRSSEQSKALRHLFFARRNTWKIPDLSRHTASRKIRSVGVLGAGTMGRGIAMNFLNAGLPTVLVDTSESAVVAAVVAIQKLYEASAAKGKITAETVGERMALLRGEATDAALMDCDLVIEAVYEDMELKKRVCARLGAVCKPGAIIATNTSTLDVDVIAQSTGRSADVVGLHFFSPANVMRLLEVIRGRDTADDVLATVMEIARRIDKDAVVSGVCYGFIGNRMAEVYLREAEYLILEGASPTQVDTAIERIGMAMGPCRMLDMAGVDVGAKTVIERGKAGQLPADPSYRALVRRLHDLGRYGQKSGSGYYKYDGRKAIPDPEFDQIAKDLSAELGIERRGQIEDQEIFERLIYSMVNEAAKILEEGIAYRGADIDVVWTAGYGFPEYQGGPLHLADRVGLKKIVDGLSRYASVDGDEFGYWSVSPLLAEIASKGGQLSKWQEKA